MKPLVPLEEENLVSFHMYYANPPVYAIQGMTCLRSTRAYRRIEIRQT